MSMEAIAIAQSTPSLSSIRSSILQHLDQHSTEIEILAPTASKTKLAKIILKAVLGAVVVVLGGAGVGMIIANVAFLVPYSQIATTVATAFGFPALQSFLEIFIRGLLTTELVALIIGVVWKHRSAVAADNRAAVAETKAQIAETQAQIAVNQAEAAVNQAEAAVNQAVAAVNQAKAAEVQVAALTTHVQDLTSLIQSLSNWAQAVSASTGIPLPVNQTP
ncbi:hypothetical protein DFQ26_008325 [Actinomortierella ambigua]|nr:hypothetical protein DFQ26_008325 [Actinomortierella ambigua]